MCGNKNNTYMKNRMEISMVTAGAFVIEENRFFQREKTFSFFHLHISISLVSQPGRSIILNRAFLVANGPLERINPVVNDTIPDQ